VVRRHVGRRGRRGFVVDRRPLVFITWPVVGPAFLSFATDGRHCVFCRLDGDPLELDELDGDVVAAMDAAFFWGRVPTDPLPPGWRLADDPEVFGF